MVIGYVINYVGMSVLKYDLTFKVKSDYNNPIILHEDRLDYENI